VNAAVTGRIDVHSHLLPGIDDGCESVAESIACARELVKAGYTHSFCTPHITPGFPEQTITNIARWTSDLQEELTEAAVPLTLLPGGEINIDPGLTQNLTAPRLVTYGGMGRMCLVDIWADRLPDFFEPSIRWLQEKGLQVILAHPERMKAVQAEPKLADYFLKLGLLLQGNLQCLSDSPERPTRITGERFLKDGRYFLLGSDLHRLETLHPRLEGLKNAIAMIGEAEVDRLTKENPKRLLS
jgi:protein-tyrosine phosphatase